MTYWTVLWITVIGGPLDGSQTGIAYRNEAECQAARYIVSDTIGDAYDHTLECEASSVPSGSIHPKPRPDGLGD